MKVIKSLNNLYSHLLSLNLKEEAEQVLFLKEAGKKEELIEKYPQYEAELTLAGNSVKPGWLQWVANQLDRKEPLNEIINTIGEFERFKSRLEKKDLYQYQTLGELREAIEEGGLSRSQKKKEVRKDISGDYDVIFEDNEFLVVHPHSREASCYFGKGTRWCVSATVSKNYFQEYAIDNIFLYFILSKNLDPNFPRLEKIAFSYDSEDSGSWTIFDKEDNVIEESLAGKYINSKSNFIEIYSAINKHIKENKNTKFRQYLSRITIEEFRKDIDSIKNLDEAQDYIGIILDIKNTPEDLLLYIYENKDLLHIKTGIDKEVIMRKLLLSPNPNIPNILRKIYYDIKDNQELYQKYLKMLAHHHLTPPDILMELSNFPVISNSILNNWKAPREVLENIFKNNKEAFSNLTSIDLSLNENATHEMLSFVLLNNDSSSLSVNGSKFLQLNILDHPNFNLDRFVLDLKKIPLDSNFISFENIFNLIPKLTNQHLEILKWHPTEKIRQLIKEELEKRAS